MRLRLIAALSAFVLAPVLAPVLAHAQMRAPRVDSPAVDARVKTTRSGAWEWHVQDGRRVASVYTEDGASFTVMCPSRRGDPGVLSAFALGQAPTGRVRLSFDGGEARTLRFRGNSFVADTSRKAQRFQRMVARIKAGSRMRVAWDQGDIRLSLRGSSGAIGDCR
ncbi:MAG: hypothetical protein AAF763_18585 [Pseudomonadota bacterium]